tara:strand:- start:139 stop:351 length:213 start_codon:yes stop_codon:yes gene_type:complete
MSYDSSRFKIIMNEMKYLLEEAYEIIPNGSHSSSLSYSTWYSKIKDAIHDEEENEHDMVTAYRHLLEIEE